VVVYNWTQATYVRDAAGENTVFVVDGTGLAANAKVTQP
jgi:hypothetical protein